MHDDVGIEDVEQIRDAGAEEPRRVAHDLARHRVALLRRLVHGLRRDLLELAVRPVDGSSDAVSSPRSASRARSAIAGPDAYASRQP